jgi:two-component system, OmpR family, sensor kinase
LAPYEDAGRYALLVSALTGVLATLAAATITAWVTRRALAPVADMARTAAEWSEKDQHSRFNLIGSHNEIGVLADTLDTLLDRVRNALRSEQRLTSELAHELRTPLTAIQGRAELALMRRGAPPEVRHDLEQIADATRRMSGTIAALLDLARNETTGSEARNSSLPAVVAEVVSGSAEVNSAIVVTQDIAAVRLGMSHSLAVRAMSPVVANALRFARSSVAITTASNGRGTVEVTVADDGPGIERAVAERLFEPGSTSSSRAGAGLGLAISRRVARSVGGDVRMIPGSPTAFVLELPVS